MIYLRPSGGLANRLRAVASAYKLSSEYGTELTVCWEMNKELNCSFDDMFSVNKDTVHIINRKTGIITKIVRKIFPSGYTDINNEAIRAKFFENFRKTPDKDYYITSFSNFYDAHNYTFLETVSSIDMRVNHLIGETVRSNLVGIQIRRTDNAESIAHSPIELFIQNMETEAKSNPNTTFYLATDDINVRNRILNLFPNRIIYNKTENVSRQTQAGMIDAMTDFIALSRCRKIYGSYWSSFSEVASDIGQNELTVVQK